MNELWLPVTNRFLRDGFAGLCPEEQRFFSIFSLLGELANGGFRRYFLGSTSHLGPAAAEALAHLGCSRAETILREAMSVFPDSVVPEDWDARQAVLDNLDEDALDQWQRLSELFHLEEDEVLQRLEHYVSGAPGEGRAAGA